MHKIIMDKILQEARRAMLREKLAWQDRVRDGVGCPRCGAAQGDYCTDRDGRSMLNNHPRRVNLFLVPPRGRPSIRPSVRRG